MTNLVPRFIRQEAGATAVEYGLIAARPAMTIEGVGTTFHGPPATISSPLK